MPLRFYKFLREHRVLIAIILLAVFLRLFYYVGILRGDDVAYYFLAHQLANGQFDPTTWGGQERIGLYYPTAILIRLFGTHEFVATLFPLLASLLTIVFLYGIGRFLHNKTAGLLAAFLWAVFPFDVFLATQLLPDGPTAMATAGTVFFFLLAGQIPWGLQRISRYVLTAFFAVWAFLIKESTITIGLVVFGLVLYHNSSLLRKLAQWLKDLPKGKRILLASGLFILILLMIFGLRPFQPPIFANNLELTSTDISSAWLLGRYNAVQVTDVGGIGYWITDRPLFTPRPLPEVLTRPGLGERIKIFDLTVPLFLVAVAHGLTNKRKEFYVPLIWFFLSFFYLEWGSYPRGLALPGLLTYTPITHWIDARNLILVCTPAIVVIALFLSHLISSRANMERVILISALLSILVAVSLQTSIFASLTLSVIHLAVLVVIAAAAYSPFMLSSSKSPRPKYQFLALAVLAAFSIGALLPMPQFHVSDYFKERASRENLRQALTFLETQPDLPIYGVGGAASWLDVYSNFQLGYDHFDQGSNYPNQRMTEDPAILDETGGYKVEYVCDQPITDFKNWPLAEFGQDIGEKTCVSLIRLFPIGNLESLLEIKNAALGDPTLANLNLYLAAAAQTGNIEEMVNALAEYVTQYPDQAPIIEASYLVSTHGPEQLSSTTFDLINNFEQCEAECPWIFGDLLDPKITAVDGEQALSIQISKKTDEIQTVNVELALKSGTAYILSLDLRSSAPFDLVRFGDLQIPDSYSDGWNKALDWQAFQIVFVTPNWAEAERNVFLELARLFDRGSIEFRQIELIELGGQN